MRDICETYARHKRFWRVGIARNCYVFPQFRGFEGSQSQLRKARWCGGSAAQDGNKICTTPARESGFCEKRPSRCMFGALLDVVELRKACTTPARESDLEVKIVKNGQARGTFGSWASQNLHHARENDFSEKKTHKSTTVHVLNAFGSWRCQNLHHACARDRFGSQNR